MTLEEIDCERRGYKLTKTVLGTGAYAKVKLAYVMENKLEKDQRLAEDLNEKGHNMVTIRIIVKILPSVVSWHRRKSMLLNGF